MKHITYQFSKTVFLKSILVLISLLYTLNTQSQTKSQYKSSETEEVFTIVEQMPSFPGGEKALYRFIGLTISYPVEAQANNESGIVYISCLISKKGKVVETWFLNSVSPSIDREAGRLVKKMPPWIPGTKNGENAKIKITISIKFTLN